MKEKLSFLQILKDQIWLLALFTPLLVLAIIGVIRWHNDTEAEKAAANLKRMVIWKTEISSAEVTKIVAKPLTELLAMEIYVDVKSEETVAISDPKEVFGNGRSNLIFTTANRRSSLQQVACLAKSGFAL